MQLRAGWRRIADMSTLTRSFCTSLALFAVQTLVGQAAPTTKGIITDPAAPKPDGVVQLVGTESHALVPESEGECNWVFAEGVLTASPKWDSLVTKESYQDFRLHVEFNVNKVENASDPEADGNSGIYIQKRYELQILNSSGVSAENYKPSYCGSLYKIKKPDQLVSKPSGEWQTYDIVFRGARFKDGTKMENARITVYQNGTLIHDDYEIPKKTGAGSPEGSEPGPIKFQGHHNPVKFRNAWIQKLSLD
jgi:hypothetical protein